ncbi:hypothetical protein CEW81_18320 [Kluyvera genomosp. 3]|uniref:Uncharacterized protein n=1 Tax=Kluyvera genomosp. 3 TaxID=2774055 RepID=A0A248KK28_9ENTR|nr:hypothetical protein CEW81_18320 [Kluyvera genomosp. 3]
MLSSSLVLVIPHSRRTGCRRYRAGYSSNDRAGNDGKQSAGRRNDKIKLVGKRHSTNDACNHGAALKPKGGGARAPVAPGGHGVSANGGTAMQPFQQVTKMADDNPLANIHQWSNLFG